MSLAQIEQELPKLTAEELDRLQAVISRLRRPGTIVASPEMLAERRRLLDEVMRGEWNVELADFEATQAKDREREAEIRARWDE